MGSGADQSGSERQSEWIGTAWLRWGSSGSLAWQSGSGAERETDVGAAGKAVREWTWTRIGSGSARQARRVWIGVEGDGRARHGAAWQSWMAERGRRGMAVRERIGIGTASAGRSGTAWQSGIESERSGGGAARHGSQGWIGAEWMGLVRRGSQGADSAWIGRHGMAVEDGHGSGEARWVKAVKWRPGGARRWHGTAVESWDGAAWRGGSWSGTARQSRSGKAGRGMVGMARWVKAVRDRKVVARVGQDGRGSQGAERSGWQDGDR